MNSVVGRGSCPGNSLAGRAVEVPKLMACERTASEIRAGRSTGWGRRAWLWRAVKLSRAARFALLTSGAGRLSYGILNLTQQHLF
jgi:hypothetical protein